MKSVYKALVLAKILRPREERMIKEGEQNGTKCNHYCHYHADLAGHAIHDCVEFRKVVQDLMDGKEIKFLSKREHFNVITVTN